MNIIVSTSRTAFGLALLTLCGFSVYAVADSPSTVEQAVNFFQNQQATGGSPMTVDAKGPVSIGDDVELPGFAFQVYDVDFTADSLTMKLVAQLEKLKVTLYDDTTFDRYYFALDKEVASAQLSEMTDENFKSTVEVLAPGTEVTSSGGFVDGAPTKFTFEKGAILITIGVGTDLSKIKKNDGSLVVKF